MSPAPSVLGTWIKALAATAIVFLPGGLLALFAYAIFRAFLGARMRAVAASQGGPVSTRDLFAELTPSKIWGQARSYFELLI